MPPTQWARRRYMVSVLSDDNAPRLAPAVRAMRRLLLDGDWHPHADLVAAGLAESDCQASTLGTQLWTATAAGVIEREGFYFKSGDRRKYRIVDWPMPDVDVPGNPVR